MILSDLQISELCRTQGMIEPYAPSLMSGGGIISYGQSSFGYDARLDREFKVFKDRPVEMIDPKQFAERNVTTESGAYCIIPPGGYILGRTVEYFRMPRDVMALCYGKSTYARCGIMINVTPLEPGWHGTVTLELHNATNQNVKVYAGEGICQFTFFQGHNPRVSYADRNGKYQGQQEVTFARVQQ